MSNEKLQLAKFVSKHPEYMDEYRADNLTLNIFCDILRKNPREIIAKSDLPHNLDLIGYKLAKDWVVTDSKAKTKEMSMSGRQAEGKSQKKKYEQSL